MIASWGLLSFLKAADTRQNASFAIRLDKKGEFENELEGSGLENPEEIFNAVGYNNTHTQRRKPDRREYSSRSNDTTMIKSSDSIRNRQIKYENISDDEFFDNLEHIRRTDLQDHTSRQADHQVHPEDPRLPQAEARDIKGKKAKN